MTPLVLTLHVFLASQSGPAETLTPELRLDGAVGSSPSLSVDPFENKWRPAEVITAAFLLAPVDAALLYGPVYILWNLNGLTFTEVIAFAAGWIGAVLILPPLIATLAASLVTPASERAGSFWRAFGYGVGFEMLSLCLLPLGGLGLLFQLVAVPFAVSAGLHARGFESPPPSTPEAPKSTVMPAMATAFGSSTF